MKKNLFLILTVVLVLAFAVPAFAALSGFTVQEKKAPENAGIVCNPGDCQQACGGNPALCAQGECDQANCPNYGVGCGNGAACGTGAACGNAAAAAGCGGGGCGGGGCSNQAPSVNQ